MFRVQAFIQCVWRGAQGHPDRHDSGLELTPNMPIFIKAVPVEHQETKNVYEECPINKTCMRGPTIWTFNLRTKEKPAKWVLDAVCVRRCLSEEVLDEGSKQFDPQFDVAVWLLERRAGHLCRPLVQHLLLLLQLGL